MERNTWTEKVFQIKPDGPYAEFLQFFTHQGWGRLLQPETNIHADLLREFYANALPENPQTDPFPFETLVRGRTIRFDREAINAFLGNPFPLPTEDTLDDFHKKQNQGAFDLDPLKEEIKRTILIEGASYDISDAGREYRAQYKFMTPPAKLVLKFILHNVKPNSHLSDCTVDVCPLIYYIIKGIKVDIARTIAWELKKVTLLGKGEPTTRLSFPGLIMGLIIDTRLRLPAAVHEVIKNPINDSHITRFIMGQTKKGASSSRGPQPPPQPEPEPQPGMPTEPLASFDMASYVQWQYQCQTHTWDMLAATNRANTYFQQSQYVMQQQAGYPPEVMAQFMTPQAFQSYVAWPEDRPNPYGGGGAYGATTGENEDEMVGSDGDDPTRVPSATAGSEDDDMQD